MMSILMIEAQLVTDEGSEVLKTQFENYCSWCWGHGYGNCDMCKKVYYRYYIPIRKRELQEKLGLNQVR